MQKPSIPDLEQRVAFYEQQAIPCYEWVDALNDLAHELADINPACAQNHSRQAMQVAVEVRYPSGEARALTMVAWLHLGEGRVDLALTRALNAEIVARMARQPHLEGHALYMLAMIHDRVGNFDEAMRARQKLVAIARELQDIALEANCLVTIGMQQTRRGAHKEALQTYSRALALYRRLQDEREVFALNNIATALLANGDLFLAEEYATKALNVCQPDNVRVYTQILHTLGNISSAMGEVDASRIEYEHILSVSARAAQTGYTTDREFEAQVRLDLAKAYAALQKNGNAFAVLQQALDIAEAHGFKPLLIDIHDQLSKLYQRENLLAMALTHAEQREATRSALTQTQSDQHEKTLRVMAILKASQEQIRKEQQAAFEERLWQRCLNGQVPLC